MTTETRLSNCIFSMNDSKKLLHSKYLSLPLNTFLPVFRLKKKIFSDGLGGVSGVYLWLSYPRPWWTSVNTFNDLPYGVKGRLHKLYPKDLLLQPTQSSDRAARLLGLLIHLLFSSRLESNWRLRSGVEGHCKKFKINGDCCREQRWIQVTKTDQWDSKTSWSK